MIIKQTEDTSAEKSVAQHARDLYEYIHALDNPANGHKLVFSGTFNIASKKPSDVIREVAELALKARRSKNPLQHWILSIAAGEKMTHDIARDMVAILARHLGYEGCQAFYGGHGNTVNDHVHVVFNRVDPATGRCRKPEFSHVRAQKAMAEICAKYGFSRVDHALFIMDNDGELHRVVSLDTSVKIPDGARASELHSGEKSACRLAAEEVVPVLSSAKTWKELHEKLGKAGWEYRKKGGGAVLACGGNEVKPSSLGKKFALRQMEKKLGPFVERGEGVAVAEKKPEPMAGVPEELLNQYKEEAKATQGIKEEYESQKAEIEEWKRIETENAKALNGLPRRAYLMAIRDEARERLRAAREEYERKTLTAPKAERFDAWLQRKRPALAESVIAAVKSAPRNVALDVGEPDPKAARAMREYFDAVGADAYELRSGDAIALDGGKRLVEPERLIALLPRIAELSDVSIVPVSTGRTHVVVEIPQELLERMREDGLSPSFVAWRGDACQCVYTIPASGVEKEISEALRQAYGGVALIGAHGMPLGKVETGGVSERLRRFARALLARMRPFAAARRAEEEDLRRARAFARMRGVRDEKVLRMLEARAISRRYADTPMTIKKKGMEVEHVQSVAELR